MEKIKKIYEKGLELLSRDKPNPKKAVNYFIKSWKKYLAMKAYDNVFDSIDKIVESYHKYMKKPKLALKYLEYKHDLKQHLKDYKGSVETGIEIARMLREYKSLKDESIEFYRRAWNECMKFSINDNLTDTIKKEVYEVLLELGKDEEHAKKYVNKHFR